MRMAKSRGRECRWKALLTLQSRKPVEARTGYGHATFMNVASVLLICRVRVAVVAVFRRLQLKAVCVVPRVCVGIARGWQAGNDQQKPNGKPGVRQNLGKLQNQWQLGMAAWGVQRRTGSQRNGQATVEPELKPA